MLTWNKTEQSFILFSLSKTSTAHRQLNAFYSFYTIYYPKWLIL